MCIENEVFQSVHVLVWIFLGFGMVFMIVFSIALLLDSKRTGISLNPVIATLDMIDREKEKKKKDIEE